ncbi:poly(ADP-ribose) glycohydrolase-like isoform X1 [Vanessa atalanta]|uniref:poly(ADP-ribose) glycohydrolase-like isoform X1 n=2 Tax=Vanessa atalanta TaxID=42275 RepID=UPI001FCD349E|nr:poly(ADP-ribose) glycohydrolase-like isoform X1 [Vanessa atalanta]
MNHSRAYKKILKTCILQKAMSTNCEWKGVPISQIIGSDSPWGAPEFPLVQPAYNHSVLYHIPASGAQLDRPPKPQIGKDKWDHEHVRMPFSSHSLYPVETSSGETHLKKRWDMIQKALNRPIRNTEELASAILSYNTKFKNKWKFRSLYELFEEHLEAEETKYFYDVTLPEMTKLALALPQLIQSPIPLLKQNKNHSISLSQQQISSILANAFFCTFPRRNTTKRDSEYASYPYFNFSMLFECSPSDHILEKLKCICHYFRRVCTNVPAGAVTVSRRAGRAGGGWRDCAARLGALLVHADATSTIEDAHGLIQVDFANKFLGGGVLNYGSVQEEIRFMICPELMISMLFTEALRPNEALMIIGCEQYSKYSGYGHSFQWAGEHVDATPRDSSGRRRCAVLAIDAQPFSNRSQEYTKEAITRELDKAWVGFSFFTAEAAGPHFPGVATGNWGCGAFGGSAPLKLLIQMMALARAGRHLAYYTFGDAALRDRLVRAHELLARHDVSVGQLYEILLKFCNEDVQKLNIFTFLEETLEKKRCQNQLQRENSGRETENYELPLSVVLDLNRSPDMFTTDDDSESITPTTVKMQSDDTEITHKKKDSSEKLVINQNKTLTSEREVAESIEPSSQTTRLFDEMEKIDNDSGKLNLNCHQNSMFEKKTAKYETVMEIEDNLQTNISPNDKKKLAKKITDYFSKKPA